MLTACLIAGGCAALPPHATVSPPETPIPILPAPRRIVRLAWPPDATLRDQVLRQTLAGLVAFAARRGETNDLIWIDVKTPAYEEWLRRFVERSRVPIVDAPADPWSLVRRYRDAGIVRGFVLYRASTGHSFQGMPADGSLNVATSLCSVLGAVAVDESQRGVAAANGLPLLADARGKDERWLLGEYGDRFPRDLLALQDPRTAVMRDAAVAFGAMVTFNHPDAGFRAALARLAPGAVVFGWGVGPEDRFTDPIGRRGATMVAANWCFDMELLGAGGAALPHLARTKEPPPRPDPKKRYVAFVLSDGDNLQWAANDLIFHADYWGSPSRGAIPMGWGIPLVELARCYPDALEYLAETATANDSLLLYGYDGYHYPDTFGVAADRAHCLALQARRTDGYLAATDIRTMAVISKSWDGAAARGAYHAYARDMPHLDAVLALQYAPYDAGKGRILWIPRDGGEPLLVMSPRHIIWEHHEATPNRVADQLEAWARRPANSIEDRYAFVIVHAWSRFRRQPAGAPYRDEEVTGAAADAGRGYLPALWCARQLGPPIEVVTPRVLVRLIIEEHSDSRKRRAPSPASRGE